MGQKRHHGCDPTSTRRARNACPCPLEPGLDRELAKIKFGRVAERYIGSPATEIERRISHGRRPGAERQAQKCRYTNDGSDESRRSNELGRAQWYRGRGAACFMMLSSPGEHPCPRLIRWPQ